MLSLPPPPPHCRGFLSTQRLKFLSLLFIAALSTPALLVGQAANCTDLLESFNQTLCSPEPEFTLSPAAGNVVSVNIVSATGLAIGNAVITGSNTFAMIGWQLFSTSYKGFGTVTLNITTSNIDCQNVVVKLVECCNTDPYDFLFRG